MALTDNLIAYWKLDEISGNAADSVNSYTLTNNNSITYSAGKINNGADLGSVNSSKYFQNTTIPNLCSYNTGLSISFWFKLGSTSGSQFFFQSQDTSWSSVYARLSSSTSIEFRFGNGISSDGGNTTCTVPTISTGDWHNIIMTHSASVNNFYFDGVLIGTRTSNVTLAGGSTGITLGAYYVIGDYLKGMIDEFGIWSRALSASEVSQLYNGGVGLQYPFIINNANFMSFM